MKKRDKIIYWIATVWLSLGMLSSGIVQLINLQENVDQMKHLGYPLYLLPIIGVWKILGVTAILVPKFPLLKEWAYAGFCFTMTGAAISHIAAHSPATEIIPALLLLVLTFLSWYFRPQDRKITFVHP